MSRSLLSSEQALDDYFSALLDDEFENASEDVALELQPEPLRQPMVEKSFYSEPEEELELPNLNDVERLLQQLEHSNPVEELELEEVLEQNTVQISLEQNAPDPEPVVDEIQDWDIEELDVPAATPPEEALLEPTVEVAAEPEVIEAEPEVITEPEVVSEPEEVLRSYTQPDIDFETQRHVHVEPEIPSVDVNTEVELQVEPETESRSPLQVWHSTERVQSFQVLYFEVNAVTFAVPLDELGGIHQVAELSHLIGRPKWYLGLQSSRDSQIDVVDTARWVMAEKLADDSHKQDYQYIVMLGDSSWGLASSKLLGTETLDPEKVRWRTTAGKRPWLAGMVKEKMCALIHVEALVAMLKAGLDVKALDK